MLFHGALLIDLVVTFHIIKRNVPDRISNDKSEKRERKREFDFNKKKIIRVQNVTVITDTTIYNKT